MSSLQALEDGTLEEVEEHAKTTKRKRKGKKDDGIDLANVCIGGTCVAMIVSLSLETKKEE